jgi:hypothetical protein
MARGRTFTTIVGTEPGNFGHSKPPDRRKRQSHDRIKRTEFVRK